MVDINTISKFSKTWLMNTIENIASVNNKSAYLLSDLENKFVGQTALIAGAGPSLRENIQNIKENRDKFVIFAVNKVAKYLIENGISPDFIICLDAKNMDRTLGGLESHLEKVNCIMDIRTDKSLFNKNFHKIFINFSETDFFTKKLSQFNKFLHFYESGGTASILALVSAIKLGFSKVVLAGIDLAFKENMIYSYGETMNRVSQNEIIVDNVRKNLIQVRSVNGGIVYTREDYQTFIYHFAAVIKELEFSEIYNISSFGALIEGVKNVSFSDLNLVNKAGMQPVAFVEPFRFELKGFMDDEFRHINDIISMLSKGLFSPALVSSIVKSVLIYQYMQANVLSVLQKNFEQEMAESFMKKTKMAVKKVVEVLQKNKLI